MTDKSIKFVGFSDALNDASSHLSGRLEKSLDMADNMYMTHGKDAVDAVRGYTDKDVARQYATDFVVNHLTEDEE
tara:strand:+ start:6817 stop:7041 length:225 start_codon:yes stop_codon:yes gene_type:complete